VRTLVDDSILKHISSCGYTSEEVNRFSEAFREILRQPRRATELLEAAVDDVNTAISSRLWMLLKDKLGFITFIQMIRNTYLLGKGIKNNSMLSFYHIFQVSFTSPYWTE